MDENHLHIMTFFVGYSYSSYPKYGEKYKSHSKYGENYNSHEYYHKSYQTYDYDDRHPHYHTTPPPPATNVTFDCTKPNVDCMHYGVCNKDPYDENFGQCF